MAAVNVTVVRSGYMRGLIFFVAESERGLRLRVPRDPERSTEYLELLR